MSVYVTMELLGHRMTKKRQLTAPSESRRAQAHAKMLKAALGRPGVKEAMEVYGGWRERDSGLNSYRAAAKKPSRIVTTNSSRAH